MQQNDEKCHCAYCLINTRLDELTKLFVMVSGVPDLSTDQQHKILDEMKKLNEQLVSTEKRCQFDTD